MSGWEHDILDGFLREASEESGLPELLTALESEVDETDAPPLAAFPSGELSLEGRFDRFLEGVASMLYIDADEARRLLDGIGDDSNWDPSPLPQLSLYHLDGGPEVKDAITGFARIKAGDSFPEHEHCGQESVLVMQGSMLDETSGQVFRPGDVATQEKGSRHSFIVREGPDLVYLVVAQQGVILDGHHFGADAPEF